MHKLALCTFTVIKQCCQSELTSLYFLYRSVVWCHDFDLRTKVDAHLSGLGRKMKILVCWRK